MASILRAARAVLMMPKTNASVPTPTSGVTFYYSTDEASLVSKNTAGVVSVIGSSNATALRGKTLNVNVGTPNDNDIIRYDSASGMWQAETFSAGLTSGTFVGQPLTWNGSSWEPGTFIKFASTAASGGTLRAGSSFQLQALNLAASTVSLVNWTADTLTFGSDTSGHILDYRAGTSGQHRFYINNVQTFTVAASVVALNGNAALNLSGTSAANAWIMRESQNMVSLSVNTGTGLEKRVAFYDEPSSWGSADKALFLAVRTAAPSATATSGAFLWSGTSNELQTHNSRATSYVGCGDQGTSATTGQLRGSSAFVLAVRNGINTQNRQVIGWASDVLTFGDVGITNDVAYASGANHNFTTASGTLRLSVRPTLLYLNVATTEIDKAVTTPVIRQEANTAQVTGQLLTINAQDVSGSGAGTSQGGNATWRAGDVSGSGGGGVYIGGEANIRAGDAAAGGSGGDLILRPGTGGAAAGSMFLRNGAGTNRFQINSTGIGVFAATPVAKQTVTGSRGGNAALASLLTALANYGWVTDSSTA